MLTFLRQYDTYTDEKLMKFIQRQDTVAFDVLYERYSKRMLYYFHRMLGGNEEKAQDFLQDLFLKIVEKPERFCTDNKFTSRIFTVAHNMCKNEYRQQSVRQIVSNAPDMDLLCENLGDDHPIEQAVDHHQFEQAVILALSELSPEHKTTFLLRHQENQSIKEISAQLNCSEGTTKSRLFYTTQKLAQKLKRHNPYRDERCI